MTQLNKEYHIVLTQDVIWGDMDAFQHVNNTVYLRYFETARIAGSKELAPMRIRQRPASGRSSPTFSAITGCRWSIPTGFRSLAVAASCHRRKSIRSMW
jgi:acyl-CoA thioester hydrolase